MKKGLPAVDNVMMTNATPGFNTEQLERQIGCAYRTAWFMLHRLRRATHIHRVLGNLKTWLNGTHHGVDAKYLQTYLEEFV